MALQAYVWSRRVDGAGAGVIQVMLLSAAWHISLDAAMQLVGCLQHAFAVALNTPK